MALHPTSSAGVPTENSTSTNHIHEAWRERPLTGTSIGLNEARADREERITFSTELNAVVRVDEVQGSLGDSIGDCNSKSALLDELGITDSARDVDDLLLDAPFDQRKESICGGDRPNDVGLILFLGSGVS